MKKKIVFTTMLIFLSALIFKVYAFDSKISDDLNNLSVTVHKEYGNGLQPNVRVKICNSSGTVLRSMLTNSVGIAIFLNFNEPLGNYTIKVWFPDLPNDQQNAEKIVFWDGVALDAHINLGPVY